MAAGSNPTVNSVTKPLQAPSGTDVVVPNAIFPRDPTGQATPAQLSNLAAASSPQQLVTAGRDSVIPLIYGGPERTAGKLYLARAHPATGALVLVQILCDGGAAGIQSIDTPEMNDQAAPGSVSFTYYLGTQAQGVDATLAAVIAGFSEAMPGTAYVVIQVPKGVSPGFPRFTFQVNGLKIFDPRDGTQVVTNPATFKWSDNPALILADFLTNTVYGARKAIDWTTVTAAANYCDGTVTGTGGTEKRALLTLSLNDKRPVRDWIEALRAYVPAWVDYLGATAVIVADMAAASTFTFTAANVDTDPKPVLKKRGVKELPTVVQIGYTKTDVKPWATAYAEASTGSTVRRLSRIDMPGIRRYSQAQRFATERLNHYQLEDLEGAIGVFEDGLKVTLGDVITVTDDIGLSAKQVRITGKEDRGFGRWTIAFREYDPAAYSSSVAVAPTTPDTGLPNPKIVAPATALVIAETVYAERVNGSALAGSLIYQSRFDVTWTVPVHAYPFVYRVEVWDGATKLRDETTTTNAYSTPAVQQGKGYTVNVFVRNSLGFESPVLTGTQIAQGKLLPPGPVPGIVRGYETGGEVNLEWLAAIDIDIVRYEWRYTPNQTAGGTWAAATLIDRPDTLRARFKGLPVGTHRFYVRAIDSVGNYSTSDATVDITISTDANSFVQDHTFTSPTLTNMLSIPALEGIGTARWETSFASDQWNSVEPSPLNSGGNPVTSYHAAGTSRWQGEAWDLGSLVTADFQLTPNVTDISGTATSAIETSPDGVTYSAQPGITFRGPARFLRPAMQSTGTMLVNAPPKITLTALSKPETGLTTTVASGITLVALAGKYSAAQDLQATAQGSSASYAKTDRLLLYPQAGLQFQWIEAAGTGGGSQDGFFARDFWSGARTLLADDYLEYEVYIDPNSPAADGTFATGGTGVKCTGVIYIRNNAHNYLLGTSGAFVNTLTTRDTRTDALEDTAARGTWQTRKISLGANAGAVIEAFAGGGDSDLNGTYNFLIRNCRITNGAGTDRVLLWPPSGGGTQTEPIANAVAFGGGGVNASGRTFNGQLGPSNTFTLYAFNSAGAQIANDVRWSFKGF